MYIKIYVHLISCKFLFMYISFHINFKTNFILYKFLYKIYLILISFHIDLQSEINIYPTINSNPSSLCLGFATIIFVQYLNLFSPGINS